MTHQDRFTEHVAKVEALDQKIEDWEKWAQGEVQKRYGHRITKARDKIAKENLEAHYLNEVLAHVRYRALIGARNSAIAHAQMYGLGALLEEVHDDYPATGRTGPGTGDGSHQPGT